MTEGEQITCTSYKHIDKNVPKSRFILNLKMLSQGRIDCNRRTNYILQTKTKNVPRSRLEVYL